MNRLFARSTAAVALAAALGFAITVNAAPPSTAPGHNKLQCFDGTTDGGFGGICALTSNGAKGPATLDNTDDNAAGDYAGVYTLDSTLYGQSLSQVTQLGYHYSGMTAPLPGDLSLNLPIDTNGDGSTEAYAFIDAYYCPGVGGVVDVVQDLSCGIYYNGVTFYPNWAALVAAFPGAKVATDNFVFVIAERTPAEPPAFWTVNNVRFGKGGK